MNQILECVPNFSEGRDLSVIEKLCDCFRGKPGVRLLDYTWDQDHNRCVLTIIGEPEPLRDAVVESIGRAVELIDMTKHQGQHPRMGCVDVVPFIPIRNTTVGDADRIAKETAQLASQRFGQPFFLYEKSATAPHRMLKLPEARSILARRVYRLSGNSPARIRRNRSRDSSAGRSR